MQERDQHHVQVDLSGVQEGENRFTCTLHANETIILIWNGEQFSLREEDANNPEFGTVGIEMTSEK